MSLLDEVVEASRLSQVIAPYAVSRLLISAGVIPTTLTPEELARALPQLEEGLAVYLQGERLDEARESIRALAA